MQNGVMIRSLGRFEHSDLISVHYPTALTTQQLASDEIAVGVAKKSAVPKMSAGVSMRRKARFVYAAFTPFEHLFGDGLFAHRRAGGHAMTLIPYSPNWRAIRE